MSYIDRLKIKTLKNWKSSANRKPLVLRGARQVGKTTLIKSFAENYTQFIYLNLEKESDLQFFKDYNEIGLLIDAIFLSKNKDIKKIDKTLLFIDEIQESPEAMSMLRYFYEEVSDLHVIAAGSLLEHTLSEIKNFPVGRVQYLYLFPLNFQEFLLANQQDALLKRLATIPVDQVTHNSAIEWFHKYAIIGGMPEIVKIYVAEERISILKSTYESIWATYKSDVEKYARNASEGKIIKHIMNVATSYLDERVTFQNFGKSNYKSREVSEAFRNLDEAKVIQLIYPTTSVSPPVQTDFAKKPRLQFLDTGIVNYSMQIQAQLLKLDDLSNAYRGAMIPHLITQELISQEDISYAKPNFWVREKRQSSAEVDLVRVYEDLLIPIEIKSGAKGTLRSLHQFIDQANHPYAVRMYSGNFLIEDAVTRSGKKFHLMNLPYYLGTYLDQYIEYFVNEMKSNATSI